MTIDEAIRHCEEVAWENDRKAMCVEEAYQTTEQQNCEQCAADHRQLAEWLTDYKELKKSIGAVKLSNMKEALALIRTLKAELNGWKEDPFGIIAEVCGAATDCKCCQWYEKCPCYPEEWYPEKWRTENG